MPRKDFINDNLLNMSDRFKRHYDEFHSKQEAAAAAEPAAADEPADKGVEAKVPSLSERVELPVVKSRFDYTEIERERRDLEGRLLRDLAFVETEQEMISHRQNAASEFRSVLQKELDNLRELERISGDLGEAECRRRTDALRAAYFKAYGRFNAIISARNQSVNSISGAADNAASCGRAGSVRETLLMISAIFAGALIVAGTMIFIFA